MTFIYIHIGGDYVVRDSEIIGIFDIDNCSIGSKTRSFFAKSEQAGNIINAADDLPKSFIVTANGAKTRVYISGVAPATLRKRAETPFGPEEI